MRTCDLLVIGSGLAGMLLALKAAEHGRVLLVTKREPEASNTRQAQGGVAVVWDRADRVADHVRDTMVAGAGLCRREVVEAVVRDGPARVRELIELGVSFSRAEDDTFELGREGGHGRRRILHAKDATGAEIVRALLERVRTHPDIEVADHHVAVDLITRSWLERRRGGLPPEDDEVLGAYVLDARSGRVEVVRSRAVALCTGGAGKTYLYTSNPDVATGDGVAMAWRAGASVLNMEFVQFHPTCLHHPRERTFLISEALRGEGGVLRLKSGERFMERYDPRAELAPRDIVARAIDAELKKRGDDCVLLDVTHLGAAFLEDRFPAIVARCRSVGIDPVTDPIPVVPAAHYFCGGVGTDLSGRTSIRRLYAVGEVACTGLHGANRLASNSLLEAAVFAHRAALDWAASREAAPLADLPPWEEGHAVDSDEQVVIKHNWEEIRRTMWNYVGIVRTTRRLVRAERRIELIRDEIRNYYWDFRLTPDLVELRNLATVAALVIRSARRRRESRGLHAVLDFPETDPRWLRDTVLRRRFWF